MLWLTVDRGMTLVIGYCFLWDSVILVRLVCLRGIFCIVCISQWLPVGSCTGLQLYKCVVQTKKDIQRPFFLLVLTVYSTTIIIWHVIVTSTSSVASPSQGRGKAGSGASADPPYNLHNFYEWGQNWCILLQTLTPLLKIASRVPTTQYLALAESNWMPCMHTSATIYTVIV